MCDILFILIDMCALALGHRLCEAHVQVGGEGVVGYWVPHVATLRMIWQRFQCCDAASSQSQLAGRRSRESILYLAPGLKVKTFLCLSLTSYMALLSRM